MYQCPNCAGNLKFDIARQKLFCEYCETTVDPYDVYKEKDAEENSDEYEVTIFTCPQCGGEIISEDTTAATFCSFCGAATILDSRVSKERRPAHIVPFTKTKEDCKKAYARMMRRAVFAPKEYKNPDNIEKFRGIYMPYWVYSYEKKGAIRVPASKTKRRGDYVYTSYYDLDCELEESYSGLSYDASASFADNLSEGIAPFDLQKSKEFTPSFLSGFYADTSDVEATVYKYDIENMVIEDGSRRLSSSSGFGRYSITNYSLKNAVRPTKKTTKLAMLPVWFLSYRNGDKVSYAVVNGQTGKVAAEIPMDPVKYAIGSAILTIPFFFLLNLFFTLKPAAVLGVAIVLAILSIVISNRQLSDLKLKETREDDKGLASKSQSSSISGVIAKSIGKVILVLLAIQLGLPVFMRLLLNIGGSDMAPVYAFALVMIFMVFASRMISMKKSLLRGEEIEKRPKVPLKEKMHTIWKPIAGIAMAFIILLVNPVNDWFYYIGVILCLAMVMWAFMDIIKHHNELTMRKLPQFNKRGGDENA